MMTGEVCHRTSVTFRSKDMPFRPQDVPFWTLQDPEVSISAHMCLDCGFIELWGNTAQARRFLRRDS